MVFLFCFTYCDGCGFESVVSVDVNIFRYVIKRTLKLKKGPDGEKELLNKLSLLLIYIVPFLLGVTCRR